MDGTWPYGPTLARLGLALAIGLFIGIERERRRKEAGLRTFAFGALLGAVGGLLGQPFALLALALLGVLAVLLNIETIRTGEGAEITTSAALVVTGFAGVLAGMGHTFTPTVLGIATAGLLAWKQPLAGFSRALTESEFRSAVLLGILAFVVYPVLPRGTVDPWQLVDPRAAWITVILIAALGFANYVLFKLYGARGIELTGFLGGLVNSRITVVELANRDRGSAGRFTEAAFKGIVLATGAMLLRNGAILLLLSPATFRDGVLPVGLMLAGMIGAAYLQRDNAEPPGPRNGEGHPPQPTFELPFSSVAALKFGLLFLAIQIGSTLAQRALGTLGFYIVSIAGGALSSASAVASAANLAAAGTVSSRVAAMGAVIASVVSALVDLPMVRLADDPRLTRKVTVVLTATVIAGGIGAVLAWMLWRR